MIYDFQNKIMFRQQIDKINSLISTAKDSTPTDSISLISRHMTRTFHSQRPRSTHHAHSLTKHTTEKLDPELQQILQLLFKNKCKDMKIEINKRAWELFLKTFTLRNKITLGKVSGPTLDLAGFGLGSSCLPHLNDLIGCSCFQSVNLSKNIINPNYLSSLQNLRQITLNNCRLNNQALQSLFELLLNSIVEKLSLSSPDLKDRNQLTRYQKLNNLIRSSKTLMVLNLSNIEIQPENGIMQACKNSVLKHLDLSDNSHVRGISPNLLSLNLSRNSISTPFELPLTPCLIQNLNLSYNKIPYFHFKVFLKNNYFPNLKTLNLDKIQLSGHIPPIQQFIQQSLSLNNISFVDCDLSVDSFGNICSGIRFNRSLKYVDLSRNRVSVQKIASNISLMMQGSSMSHLKMRHCDIKDNLGSIIFTGLNKSRHLQSIDMMNNLLGDETARIICRQLKKAKNILELKLDQNIIKYRDKEEIQSYLQGNRHFGSTSLDQQYRELYLINRQQEESNRRLQEENNKVLSLQQEADQLEIAYFKLFKVSNEERKKALLKQIHSMRQEETQLQQELFVRETMMVPNLRLSQISSNKIEDSDFNPQINIPSPTRPNY